MMVGQLTALATGIIVASAFLIILWGAERDDAHLTDPYVLINLGVIAVAGAAIYNGVFESFQTVISPLTEFLMNTVGLPDRWNPEDGLGAARYTQTDLLRVLVAVPVFLYASYRDLEERIVRNWVWYPVFTFGFLFLAYDLWTGTLSVLAPWVLGNVLFVLVLGYGLFRTRLFGGADMKALWGLGLLIPTYPALIVFPHILPPTLPAPQNAMNMFALTILSNTALVALFWPLHTLYKNARDGFNVSRPGLMLTARRVPLSAAASGHGKVLPLWTVDTSGPLSRFKALITTVVHGFDTRILRDYLEWHNEATDSNYDSLAEINSPHLERFLESDENHNEEGEKIWKTGSSDEAINAFNELLEQDTVWMTPGIPFIVPMFIGLLTAFFIGDIVYWAVITLN